MRANAGVQEGDEWPVTQEERECSVATTTGTRPFPASKQLAPLVSAVDRSSAVNTYIWQVCDSIGARARDCTAGAVHRSHVAC